MPARTAMHRCRALLFLLIIIGLPFGPSSAQIRKAPPAPAREVPPAQPHKTIRLEIIEKDTRPKAPGDEYLYFRLYENGEVEFETRPADKSSQNVRLHKINLEEEDYDKLIDFVDDSMNLPNDFYPMDEREEQVANTIIKMRDEDGNYKQTVIHFYSLGREVTRLNFSESARKLLQKAKFIRDRALSDV